MTLARLFRRRRRPSPLASSPSFWEHASSSSSSSSSPALRWTPVGRHVSELIDTSAPTLPRGRAAPPTLTDG
eukprot:9499672-Pyramimonas_sp.AAC.1